jgi:hypothetical protein
MSGRDTQAVAAEWRRFTHETGIRDSLVTDALRRIEESTGVPRDRLRPSDRFTAELAAPRGWEFDDSVAELEWAIDSDSKRMIDTVSDFVRALASSQR